MIAHRDLMWGQLLCSALILSGCASSPIEHFYTVSSVRAQPDAKGESNASGIAGVALIAVMPVTLPALIDRPQLVVRTSPHEIGILENHRWAEPLAADLTRALVANLRRSGGGLDFVAASSAQSQKAEQVLEVDITELLTGPGPVTSLQASWVLRDRSRTAVKQGKVAREVPTNGGDPAIAGAYADAMGVLAQAIAQAVRLEPAH